MIDQTVMDGGKHHLVLIPLMAQGHMIPMVDMARLLADRGGALVTFVTTPLNASRIQPTIDRAHQSGLPIRFVTLRFPCAEAGLPDGCESADTMPSRDLMRNFFDAAGMLRDPLISHLRSHGPPPSCIIADMCHPWAHEVAREFRVPRLIFHGFGCFSLLCLRNIKLYKIHDNSEDPNQPVPVPGMPHRVEITSAQAPGYMAQPSMEEFREEMWRAEEAADGVVVNSCDDLEPSYREWYRKSVGKKVWTIGPLSLHNRDAAEVALRGNKASIDESRCRSWLDSMKSSSVLYVSFGSLVRTATAQLIEIGLGLEASDRPFIWVIKAGDRMAEVEEWLSRGFEERTDGRGLVIRGWAPQVTILSHPSVGGFMTHCGWNSMLEGMSAGVPLITWPSFGEQFLNEKLTVEILRIGVPIGAKSPTFWWTSDAISEVVVVGRQEVEKAVRELMDEGKEGEERRERAREVEKKARRAMEEGGSSHANLKLLIQHISEMNDDIHKDEKTNVA